VRSWLWAEVQAGLADALRTDPGTGDLLLTLEDDVRSGRLLPPQAARALIRRFRQSSH
jgi:hypothetical protein